VTVDLYEMGSPLAAVGVFRRESPAREADLPGTTLAAISPPYQALLVKGRTYVKVNVYEGEITESQGRELLGGLAAALSGDDEMPQEFSLLPQEGKVTGSEGYQPGSLLSLEELTDCLYASYEGSDGETWEGFVVLPASAPEVWENLADRWESFEHGGFPVLYREVPYTGLVGVTRTDLGVFGVSGVANEAQLRERLSVFTLRGTDKLRPIPADSVDEHTFRQPLRPPVPS